MIGEKLGPYEILESIGSGGMGEVWKARDTRLGRIVAIKKVKEQHSERFKQEAKTIAALNHPNICQIHDIGDDYLVLEYVEGKPLSSPLEEQEAVRLAIQIATALEEAHQQGIVHRDLKPSNIMVTSKGSVKLLDFGLAKLYEQHASISNLPTEDVPATQAGVILGTVAYMSPEQAQGQPADARSDIFSFGLVLYEMLSGKKAFSGDSTPEIMAALLRDDPAPLQTSPLLEKIVKRCLEKEPSKRYQVVLEVRSALEKIPNERASKKPNESQPSIAVLPFVNMSGDTEQEYFSDGLAEEIINALTKIPGLKVAARTSSFLFRGKSVDIHEISTKLNVKSILEGSVRKSGNRIRVTAQLINAADGYHLWSERYDREITDIFAIQDEISMAIADKLRPQLLSGRSLVKRHTKNVEAYNLYWKGRYHILKATLANAEKSKEYTEQAIAIDSNYAPAWFQMGLYYWCLGYFGTMSAKESYERFTTSLEKALELDDMQPEARSGMGVKRAMEFDWKGAEGEFRRILELNPEEIDVWLHYSIWYLMPLRRFDEAVAVMQDGLDRFPLSPNLQRYQGILYFTIGKYDRAIKQFQNTLELDASCYLIHLFLGISYIKVGKPTEGIQAIEAAKKLWYEHLPIARGLAGFAYAQAGQIGDARKMLEEMKEQAQTSQAPAIALACICQGLGKADEAFDWLEKATEEPNCMLLELHASPIFDSLHLHPLYKDLLRKMNLEP